MSNGNTLRMFKSKEFNEDLRKLRGDESLESFATKLSTTAETLAMVEDGKAYPTGDEFRKVCEMLGKDTDEYFIETDPNPPLTTLMKMVTSEDRVVLEEMFERINIKRKYELLKEREYRNRYLDEKGYTLDERGLADELIIKINNTYFELGYLSEIDAYFELIFNGYSNDVAINMLNCVLDNEKLDDRILHGVVHILTCRELDENRERYIELFNKIVDKIEDENIKAKNNIELIDDFISCAAKWNSKELLPALNRMNLKDVWLDGYKRETIQDIIRCGD